MSEKHNTLDQDRLYFITFAVVEWVDVLTIPIYKDLLLDSLRYYQKSKGFEVYSWCIMSNHIHMIVGRTGSKRIGVIIRDFERYTSVAMIKAIKSNMTETRKDWLLWIFRKLAEKSSSHQNYCFWQNEYRPIELRNSEMMQKKLDYIHANPIVEGLVLKASDYVYSSAIDYAGGKGLLEIKFI